MFVLDQTTHPWHRPSTAKRVVLAVGKLPAGLAGSIRTAVERTGGLVCFQPSATGARHELSGAGLRPRCVLVDENVANLAGLVEWLRNDASLFDIPVIALVAAPTEHAFVEAKRCGADDAVVRSDWAAITRRVAALDCYVPGEQPIPVRGVALLAHHSPRRRRRAGWILRRAGYELAFAASRQEIASQSRSRSLRLVVVSADLLHAPDAQSAASAMRAESNSPKLPIIVLASSERQTRAYLNLEHTAACVDDGSWERLLFQVGELTRPDVTDLRSSPRTYLSAFCAFRQQSEFEPVYALTYNVSEGGMFIRTMDPPRPESTISVELRPPDETRDVLHVRGQVVWVQRPLHGSSGATPAGFGARLIPEDCPPRDLERYRQMCHRLHQQQFPAPSGNAEL
jgi:DNA-binding response OmpR family regulator